MTLTTRVPTQARCCLCRYRRWAKDEAEAAKKLQTHIQNATDGKHKGVEVIENRAGRSVVAVFVGGGNTADHICEYDHHTRCGNPKCQRRECRQ